MQHHRFGAFELRTAERLLLHENQPVAIGARAFDLLLALVSRRGELVTKSELLDCVWSGLVVEEANVQVQVSGLRKLLGPHAIATVPGLGYRFTMVLQEPTGAAAALASQDLAVRGLAFSTGTLVGRDEDVSNLHVWLAESRLVTVLGPGGIGKTRLAQQVARHEFGEAARGTAWVDLAALTTAEHLPAAIANAANVQLGDGHGNAVDSLLRALGQREMLLVLDNCEHLAAEVGALAHAILSAAPRIRLLATSQELLKVAGERVYRLDPLAVPPPGTGSERLLDFTAAQLLLHRARLVDRGFAFLPESATAIVSLLRHLDGIPLAIEMAAARLPLFGPQALDARLSEWLRLLRGASHGVPARQHTLRATLEWSHSLLAAPEQALLRRLSLFVGGFRIDTAQHTAAGADLDDDSVLDGLAVLVDKSLVQVERLDPPRYRLLETMRLYAAERLAEPADRAEAATAGERHGQAMAALAVEIEVRFWEMGDRPWLDLYACEYDDLQAAFDRACARDDVEVAAPTAHALLRLDTLRGINAPRRRRAELLFAMRSNAGPEAAALIWTCIASHGLIAIREVSRVEAARHAVAAWRALGNPVRLHFALGFHAAGCSRACDFEAADAALAEMRVIEDPAWPLRRRLWGASAWSGVCLHRGDAAGYRTASHKELELADQAGAEGAAAWARLKLADAALMAGDAPQAIELGHCAVSGLRTLTQPSHLGLALSNLCAAQLLEGQHAAAAASAVEALPLMWLSDWGYLLADSLALLAARAGRWTDAGLLLGFVDAWYEVHADERQPNEARLAWLATASVESAIGTSPLAQLRRDGALLTDAHARLLAQSVAGTRLDAGLAGVPNASTA